MHRQLIVAIIAVVFLIVVTVACMRAYLTEETGKHSKAEQPSADPFLPSISDDTEQLSVTDRLSAYMEAQERLTDEAEHQASEEEWGETMRQIFADSARIDALLNSGVMAFPDWTDSDYPHNDDNYTCPGRGAKCLCWDIAWFNYTWEKIAS